MTSPTPFQLLPRLSDAEFEALREDIRENGIRVPIDVDESGLILDGHHRSWIGAELGIEVPRRVVGGLDEQGKRNHARAVNAIRRHLSIEQRREQVAQMRAEGQTIVEIATTLGVPKSTIGDDVKANSESGITPPTITASDGRERPASYKTTERTSQSVTTEVQADPETGEVIEPEPVGVDGKEFKRPEPKPKPRVMEGGELADYDARQNVKSVSDALQTLDLMTTAAHRQRVTTIWWPRATENEEVPPWGRDLFKPEPIRQIAQALISLANELENQS